jgi:LAGLIDADG endonuclease
MCGVCDDFERRLAAGNVDTSLGAIAQVVERLHGMEEARGSSPRSSTYKHVEATHLNSAFEVACRRWVRSIGFVLAGFIAGEGCFTSSRAGDDRVDGSRRTRFVFAVAVAERDRSVLDALRTFLGRGSIRRVERRNPRWLPIVSFAVSSRKAIREVVIPFCEEYLVASAKREQFEIWRDEFVAYELVHPTRWGAGPATCSEPGCNLPVRGRGLCRRHYYRATGY